MKTLHTNCRCGNASTNHKLVRYYKRKDGVMSEYINYDKRCLKCINKGKYAKRKKQPTEDKESNYAY